MPEGDAVTGTREGEPLCDEPVDVLGGLCDNTVFRDGKCAVHWGRPAPSRTPPPQRPQNRKHGHGDGSSKDGRTRGGRPIERPPEGMDAVWEACRRYDRLYDATLQRQDRDYVRRSER